MCGSDCRLELPRVGAGTRSNVVPNQPLIIGFLVPGGTKTVLIRAVGPTLGGFGVTDANPDTKLAVYSGQTVIASNDNWSDNSNASDVGAAAAQSEAFALTSGS